MVGFNLVEKNGIRRFLGKSPKWLFHADKEEGDTKRKDQKQKKKKVPELNKRKISCGGFEG